MSFFKDLNNKLNESMADINEAKKCEQEEVEEGVEEVAPGNVEEVDEGFEEITESMSLYVCNECGCLCESVGPCPECESNSLEEAMKVVVRDGKVMKKKVGKKKRMSAKQKAALAKARKKAHSGAAQKARAKSMKVRNKKVHEAEDFECPECGFVGAMQNIEPDVWECPDCGAELEMANEEISESIQSQVDDYLELLEVPQEVMNEGYQACIDYLSEEFGIVIE